jgi:hypothetical protein
MDVISELRKIGPKVDTGDFELGLRDLADVWSKIPNPKTSALNAYLVIEYGVAFALKSGNLDEAQRWALLAPEFRENRHDSGEVEFLMGKVAFERGDLKVAKQHFLIADEISGGRMFEGEPKKYADLIR